MSSQDWFGVVVRALGLWAILEGVLDFVGYLAMWANWLVDTGTSREYAFFYAAFRLGSGLVMLLGADVIVRLAYTRRELFSPRPENSDDEPD